MERNVTSKLGLVSLLSRVVFRNDQYGVIREYGH